MIKSLNFRLILSLALFILFILSACDYSTQNDPVVAHVDFNNFDPGAFSSIQIENYSLHSKNGEDRILEAGGRISSQCLLITGGEDHVVTLELIDKDKSIGYISLKGQLLSNEGPFKFKIESYSEQEWKEIFQADSEFATRKFSTNIYVPITRKDVSKIRFRCTTPSNGGLLLDEIVILDPSPMKIKEVSVKDRNVPLLINRLQNPVQKLTIIASGENNGKFLETIRINSKFIDEINGIETVEIFYTGSDPEFNTNNKFGNVTDPSSSVTIQGKQDLHHGPNHFWISYSVSANSDIRSVVQSQIESVKISGKNHPCSHNAPGRSHRLGIALRDHNEDNVHSYRIPGLVTTNNGILIAVYDIRRNGSVDLQADIDVGMSRSADGGNSWEPMKVIMDMGNWGGLSDEENGIGDPSVLVDKTTNTIWVAAVWAHGHKNRRNWLESKPGMDPVLTSQFMLVKSEDDGFTWSAPMNITKQIKMEEWPLLLQGPGKGITLSDGTLVFPAQFKDRDKIPHSTIIWSKDHGISWQIGKGAKSNTTESQVIELDDGSLMLNMRDNRNREDKSESNGRSVATSSDLGQTWEEHRTSRGDLIEPVCMGSIIKNGYTINGNSRRIVLFSNPNSKYQRKNITIKFSFDDGDSWPSEYNTLLDEGVGRGYSCMTKIDDQHIGILYESSRADLVFQIIDIEEIINSVQN
jgi:sialidase-1